MREKPVEKPLGKRLSFNSLLKLNKILIGIKEKCMSASRQVLWARLNIAECHHGVNSKVGLQG